MHSIAPLDYTTVSIGTNNILRFRGGNNMDREASFSVTIASDDVDELEESFFISYEPVNNAVIIPPTTEVKICGGEYYTL